MTQTPKHKFKSGDPVMLPSGIVQELTSVQYVHNRYQLYDVSGWQYGIEHLQPADWKTEALKWREEALRQYPTPEAYETACAARDKHQKRADDAETRLKFIEAGIDKDYPAFEQIITREKARADEAEGAHSELWVERNDWKARADAAEELASRYKQERDEGDSLRGKVYDREQRLKEEIELAIRDGNKYENPYESLITLQSILRTLYPDTPAQEESK